MADVQSDETTPTARAACARVVKEIEAQKRAMRMKPMPKPIDVTVKQRIAVLDSDPESK